VQTRRCRHSRASTTARKPPLPALAGKARGFGREWLGARKADG